MSSRRVQSHAIVHFFDDWFVPIAFGVMTVLVGVQLISLVPSVRNTFDLVEGRFAALPTTVVPAVVKQDSAVVILSASNTALASQITVYRNGHSLGTFSTNQMRVTVREGDRITFRDVIGNGQSVSVSVDTDSAKLLLPAPGERVSLGNGVSTAALSKAQFM